MKIQLNGKNDLDCILKENDVVLIYFWSDWCNICKALDSLTEDIVNKYGNIIKLLSLNVVDNENLVSELNINCVPVMLLFNKGKEVKRFSGSQCRQIFEFIENFVKEV